VDLERCSQPLNPLAAWTLARPLVAGLPPSLTRRESLGHRGQSRPLTPDSRGRGLRPLARRAVKGVDQERPGTRFAVLRPAPAGS